MAAEANGDNKTEIQQLDICELEIDKYCFDAKNKPINPEETEFGSVTQCIKSNLDSFSNQCQELFRNELRKREA